MNAIEYIYRKMAIYIVVVRALQFFFVAWDFNTGTKCRRKIRVRVSHI